MEDIAPKLLEDIKEDFRKSFDENKKIKEIYKKIKLETATYKDANEFAIETGEILAAVFEKHIRPDILPDGKLYYNIADRAIRPMLENNYDIVADVSMGVQSGINKRAGIGIKALKPELNEDRVHGIVDKISEKKNYDAIAYMLREPIINFTQSVIDETVRANADFQYEAGLSPKIIRTSTGKCCEWCEKLAGTYEYDDVSDKGNDVFRRHRHCRCLVEYAPGDGTRQNVHTKKWRETSESAKIEERKRIALKPASVETPKERERRIEREAGIGFAERITSHPKMFRAYTPQGLKKSLESAGYEVKPLARGGLKGISFEEGGGFKVNFGGDGILQYHPENGSHHGGAYYKISTGKDGKKWYDMKGNEIDVEKTEKAGRQVKKKI